MLFYQTKRAKDISKERKGPVVLEMIRTEKAYVYVPGS